MANSLIKNTDVTYVGGKPGTPPTPGSPARVVTSTVRVCGWLDTTTGIFTVASASSGGGHTAGETSKPASSSGPFVYICGPQEVTSTVPAIPPKPGIPAVAPTTVIDYHLGWNSGGRSVLFFTEDGYTEFSVRTSVVGVIVGLNVADTVDAKYLGNNIDFAFYCGRGVARIQENGHTIMSVGSYSDASVFRIERIDTDIVYSVDGTVYYTNTGGADSSALRLETSMYSGGDEVFDPTIVQVSESDLTEQSGTIDAVLPPLASTIFGGGFHAEMRLTLPGLITEPMESGIAKPSFAVLGGVLPALNTLGSRMMTGTIGSIDAHLPALDMLAADHPYGETFLTLPALRPLLLAYEGNTNASMGGMTAAHDRFDAFTHVVVRIDSSCTITGVFGAGTIAHAQMLSTAGFNIILNLQAILHATLYSGLLVSGNVGGKNPTTGAASGNETWAVNVDNNGSTSYDNYVFNSYAQIGKDYYGANESGIFLLDGASDVGTPIRASVSFGTVRFSTTEKKTVQECYVGMAASGNLYLKVIAEGQEYIYKTRSFSEEIQQQRVTPGKGMRTNYVTLEIYNENGVDFEIDTVKFVVADMKRRI